VGIRGTCVNYLAFAIVGAILWLGPGAHRCPVNFRLLSFFGYISYGLYLIHVLCLDLYNGAAQQFSPSLSVGTSFAKCCLRLLIALTVATAITYVSRVTYEEFFLRMKDKRLKARDRRGSRVLAALPQLSTEKFRSFVTSSLDRGYRKPIVERCLYHLSCNRPEIRQSQAAECELAVPTPYSARFCR